MSGYHLSLTFRKQMEINVSLIRVTDLLATLEIIDYLRLECKHIL